MSSRRLFLSLFLTFILILSAHWLGFLNTPEKWLRVALTPITKTFYWLGQSANNLYQTAGNRPRLVKNHEDCQKTLQKIFIDQTEMILLRQENEHLRAQLNFTKQNKKIVIAQVISQNVDGAARSLVINRGASDGLQTGLPVIVNEGILLGKIIKIESNMAIVRPLTNNQSKTAAAILNQESTTGVVQGRHGLSIQMTMIPQNETLQIGDLAITSGWEEKIPRGLIIGQIESIQKELYEPFQSANLRPLADYKKANLVTVLLP